MYHAEKVRSKIVRTYKSRKSDVKENYRISSTGKVVKRGHWKIRIFKFKIDQIESARQFERTFKVVLKSI